MLKRYYLHLVCNVSAALPQNKVQSGSCNEYAGFYSCQCAGITTEAREDQMVVRMGSSNAHIYVENEGTAGLDARTCPTERLSCPSFSAKDGCCIAGGTHTRSSISSLAFCFFVNGLGIMLAGYQGLSVRHAYTAEWWLEEDCLPALC